MLVELNNIKFLGLQLGSQLTWKVHINYVLNKLNLVCFVRRRLVCVCVCVYVCVLNIETLKVVYYARFISC
jgi:hypothetical protein